MRIAAISDIHGNTLALDAVLADARAEGIDEIWALGDLVALGHDPVGVLERLTATHPCKVISGNTDRYVLGPWPEALPDLPLSYPGRSAIVEAMTARFWTAEVLAGAGWRSWLASLPSFFTVTLPDGTLALAVHASPGRDDGPGIGPHRSEAELADDARRAESDLLLVGHTHLPFDRTVGGTRLVNLGSVTYGRAPDLRASYVIIHATSDETLIEHRRVSYDIDVSIESLRQVDHPYPDYLIGLLNGHGSPL